MPLNTLFINNTAISEDGGAINFHENLICGIFDNVVFEDNTGGNGGAVNVDANTNSNSFNNT